jgi:hypothetical protein
VTLVSAAMLALETLLPRIFAISVGPNFVYFSISIALVGLSSGGIFASVWEAKWSKHPQRNLAALALAFSAATFLAVVLTYAAGTWLNQAIDSRYAAILAHTQPGSSASILSRSIVFPSMLFVLATGLVMAIPFLFAGLCVSLAFRFCSKAIGQIYAYDLLGAGLGCIFTVVSLTWLSATNAFLLISLFSAAGGLLFSFPVRNENRKPFLASCAVIAGFVALFSWGLAVRPLFEFRIHKYAHLRSFSDGPIEELEHRWTPLGRISLLHRQWSPPLNRVPRLRPKYFVAMDLGGHSVVEAFSPENLALIKYTSIFSDDIVEPIVVPGWYRNLRDYLVLMAGNGQDMMRAYAWYGDTIRLEGVELNPVVYEFGFDYPPANLRAFFAKPNVHMMIDEGRSYVERSNKTFDLILLSYSGATFATGTGSLASTPQFLFTREAYLAYLRKLNPGGVLVVAGGTATDELPDSLRTFAAALKVLNPTADIRRHVLCYRRAGDTHSEQYVIYHRDPLTEEEISRIKAILASHNLELSYSAFTPSSYRKIEEFFRTENSKDFDPPRGFRPLAHDRIHSDNQPFYYFNLVWGSVGGYLVLGYLATLGSALAVSLLFLLLPLYLTRASQAKSPGIAWHYFVGFALLGSGFMLIEVGSIQKFELFLGNPTLTLVVILSVLLIFTGMGSYFSTKLFDAKIFSVRGVSLFVVSYGLFVLFFLNYLIYRWIGFSLATKISIIAATLFPLGFFLGNLFPQLLRQLEPDQVRFIPLAWAINGIFSVASANLGAIIYLFFGATAVVVLGLLCYAVLGLGASLFLLPRVPGTVQGG